MTEDNLCFEAPPSAPIVEDNPSEYYQPFTCKANLCVFCVDLITENDSPENPEESRVLKTPEVSTGGSVDTFLQGISVFCDILKASNASKFSSQEEWAAGADLEQLVSLVCCEKCYGLLAKLVSMHQLILATQATLNEGVRKIESFLVESQQKVVAEDREYSVNACVLFREEILKHICTRGADDNQGDAANRTPHHRPRRKISSLVPKDTQSPDIIISPGPPSSEVHTAFVKLERLDIPTTSSHQDPPPCSEYNDFDANREDDEDKDYRPSYGRPSTGRKRGRPRKHPKIEKVAVIVSPRKRGRPRKLKGEEESPPKMTDSVLSTPPELPPVPESVDKPVLDRGGRSQRKKKKIIYAESEPCDGDNEDDVERDDPIDTSAAHEEEDEDYQPEEGESTLEEDKPPPKPVQPGRRRGRPPRKNVSSPQSGGGIPVPMIKPARGRPAQIGSRRYRCLMEEGPKHKPIYQLDASQGHLMFYNVKFLKTPYFLQCLHPNCDHVENFTGYFGDQVTFRNFRFHVRHVHRSKNMYVDGVSKNFYYCHHCETETQFDTRDDLLEHRRTLHPDVGMPPVLCEICGDAMSQTQIVKHTILHKNDEEKKVALAERPRRKGKYKDITQPIYYPCDECNKVFKCHTELRIHKQSHIPLDIRRQWICEICGEKLASQNTVESHKRRVHFKNLPSPFKCPICSRTYLSCDKLKFDTHVRSHTGDRPFICPQCGKGFHCKWNLTKHERLHTAVSVSCEFCSNVYKSYRYLRRHHLKHHPDMVERPNPEVTAKYKSGEHGEGIFGPKLMFPCEPCNHVYVYKSMLITHLKGKHNMQLANKEDYPVMWTFEDHYAGGGRKT